MSLDNSRAADPRSGIVRVVLTGAESTGKTTLSRRLADHYGCPLVEEQLRRFVEMKGALPAYEDLAAILDLHRTAQEQAIREATSNGHALVILDADPLSLKVFWTYVFGAVPDEIEQYQFADLYLLLATDIPWEADPGQRDGPHVREATQPIFRRFLEEAGVPFTSVEGDAFDRFDVARRIIDETLERGRSAEV